MKVRYKVNGRDVAPEEFSAGSQEKLREMLATGVTPSLMTDAVFLQGHCNGSQFAESTRIGDHYAGEAKKAGVNVKGKIYLSGLAAFPGDPRAWVSDRGDVQKVCEERNFGCKGAVATKCDTSRPEPELLPRGSDE